MYIDTHAHLYLSQFDADIDDVMTRCLTQKVTTILLPNIDTESIDQVWTLCQRYPQMVYPMLGLHPCSVSTEWKSQLDEIKGHLLKKDCVAIGEIGVDLYWDQKLKAEQIDAFETQIQWAKSLDLPIAIHSRSALDLTIDIVSDHQDGNLKGVFHCFDGEAKHLDAICDLGFYIGLGGILTYKKNSALRAVVERAPLDRIVLETDAPYLPPVPYRGKRNERSDLPIVAEALATIHSCDVSDIATQTTRNSKNLFSLS